MISTITMLNSRFKRFPQSWRRQAVVAVLLVVVLLVSSCCLSESYAESIGGGGGSSQCTNGSLLRYITYEPQGGLGNRLFEYASTYGLARRFGLQLLIDDGNLERVFGGSLSAVRLQSLETASQAIRWLDVYESVGSAYDRGMVRRINVSLHTIACSFACDMPVGIRVHGYLQSYRYFESHLSEIRSQFAFSRRQLEVARAAVQAVRDYNATALDLLSNLRFEWEYVDGKPQDLRTTAPNEADVAETARSVVVVGVHIRRGDMVHNMQMVSAGYQTAGYHYLLNATRYFRRKFASQGASVRFFVSSNDLAWTRDYFPFPNAAVFTGADTPSGSPAHFAQHGATTVKDMLVLAHCDAVILTVGSYGFWAATLGVTHKPVVYYARPFRNGSRMELTHNFTVHDYYPTHWLGMTG